MFIDESTAALAMIQVHPTFLGGSRFEENHKAIVRGGGGHFWGHLLCNGSESLERATPLFLCSLDILSRFDVAA